MTNKIKTTPRQSEMPEKDGRQTPRLDLSDAAVRELVRTAKKRGYIAHDRISALLASEEVNSEQIENILAKFSEMGINVVDTKEASSGEEVAAGEESAEEEEEEGE